MMKTIESEVKMLIEVCGVEWAEMNDETRMMLWNDDCRSFVCSVVYNATGLSYGENEQFVDWFNDNFADWID